MKIAVVDIETTGFNPRDDCLVEIGIVELDLETGEKRVLFDQIVREDHYTEEHANSWVFSNSDLTHEEVMAASPLDFETVQDILIKYSATAYNKKFDFGFLEYRGFVINSLLCPMIVATDVCRIPGRFGGNKWPTVTEAYNFLFGDDSYVEKHRGIEDAMDEADIVYELYKLGHYKIRE